MLKTKRPNTAEGGIVVGFGTTRSEANLGRGSTNEVRNSLPSIFNSGAYLSPVTMDTARIAKMLTHKREHGIQHFRVQRGCGGVIEIHSHAIQQLDEKWVLTAKIKDSGGVAGILLKSQILQTGFFAIHATFRLNQYKHCIEAAFCFID